MHKNQDQMHLPYAQRSAIIAFMQKDTVRRVLQHLIDTSGLRPTEVARHAGVSQSTLSRILSGKIEHPSDRQIDPLAKFFGLTGDQLRGHEPLPEMKSIKVPAAGAAMTFSTSGGVNKLISGLANVHNRFMGPNISPPPKLDGYVPIINWVQAGAWTEVCDIEFEPEEFAPRPPNSSISTFALRVRGQSMLPKYEPDLIIYVDPEVVPFDGDDVVALLTEHNEATFKQLVEEPGGGRLLKARNPSWPEPWIHINGNCEIIGVVVGSLWLRKPRS